MTDKELIQALRYCADGACTDCHLWDSVECHREVTYRNSADRLEALLAENEHLREVTKLIPRWRTGSEPPEEYRNEYGELKCFLVFDEYCTEPYRAVYDGKNWEDGWDSVNVTYWCELPERPSTEGVE